MKLKKQTYKKSIHPLRLGIKTTTSPPIYYLPKVLTENQEKILKEQNETTKSYIPKGFIKDDEFISSAIEEEI